MLGACTAVLCVLSHPQPMLPSDVFPPPALVAALDFGPMIVSAVWQACRAVTLGSQEIAGKREPRGERGLRRPQSDTTADPAPAERLREQRGCRGSGGRRGRGLTQPPIQPPRTALTSSAGVGASANADVLSTSPPSLAGKAAAAHLHLPGQTQPGPLLLQRSARPGLPEPPVTTAGNTDTSKRPPNKKVR
ncbi:hypothetical protein NDU88_002363 [Pleurodeles waltl]|uniref:Uncharacterized protein n=1 Tax=Pleurodeles waltl TaxID=8319 RepID=A0AAV7UVD2_PLEWA|nr:hypothetical protein NDU88_002363 [Pleurodeles waltl]